jgi:hypothetical protein
LGLVLRDESAMKVKKVASALFYGIASLMITFANKIVLTSYG